MILDAKIPAGPLAEKWSKHKFNLKLVNPANKRKYTVIVVGTGLAGASAAASLAELGYNVKAFCFQDSPRRAHSIAAQGGINAAKNYFLFTFSYIKTILFFNLKFFSINSHISIACNINDTDLTAAEEMIRF